MAFTHCRACARKLNNDASYFDGLCSTEGGWCYDSFVNLVHQRGGEARIKRIIPHHETAQNVIDWEASVSKVAWDLWEERGFPRVFAVPAAGATVESLGL